MKPIKAVTEAERRARRRLPKCAKARNSPFRHLARFNHGRRSHATKAFITSLQPAASSSIKLQ